MSDARTLWRRFFFEFSLPAPTLVLFRVAFFTLVGLDGWLQIEHTPRYGMGGFNVSHLPWLDDLLPVPTRTAMIAVYLIQSYLGFRIAAGVAIERSLWLLTAVYGYAYFASQLDSYQHHYLVFLLLLLCCLVPWRVPPAAPAPPPPSEKQRKKKPGLAAATAAQRGPRVASWAVRLILVQISIAYLWAAFAKLAPAWLDGATLSRQLTLGWGRDLVSGIGFPTMAKLVIAAEVFLAIAIHVRRLRPLALVAGVLFHLSIELLGFKIGLFSYLMIALYLLLLPDAVVERAAALGRRIGARATAWLPRAAAASWPALALALPLGWFLLSRIPLPATGLVGLIAGMLLIGDALRSMRRRPAAGRPSLRLGLAAAHVGACALLLVCHAATDQAFDHYRLLGGAEHRLGTPARALAAYRMAAELDPSHARSASRIGDLLAAAGRDQEALAAYERALVLAPNDVNTLLNQARLLGRTGQTAAAVAVVDRVLKLAPGDQQARQLRQALAGTP